MEEEVMKQQKQTTQPQDQEAKRNILWDCDSSLYDSFELKSFERQLGSAITSARSLSMPHFVDRHRAQPPTQAALPLSKKSSRISRSLHKLIRSVFRPKQVLSNNNIMDSSFGFQGGPKLAAGGVRVVYVVCDDGYGGLSTIPENTVAGGDRVGVGGRVDFPEIRSVMGKSASCRFSTPTSIGISCA